MPDDAEKDVRASIDRLGEEHPDTLRAKGNLARTLYAQGDHDAARVLQEQVLETMRRVLGEEPTRTRSARWATSLRRSTSRDKVTRRARSRSGSSR